MREKHYIAERGLATSLYLALKLNRRAKALPQFVEVRLKRTRERFLRGQPAGLPCTEQAALAPLA